MPKGEWIRADSGGAVIEADRFENWIVKPGDEVWLVPALWGDPTTVLLITIGVGLLFTAASYFLFKPPGLTEIEQEDPTYGFRGIRSVIAQGTPIPVRYGRMRVGGMTLQASIDREITVGETGVSETTFTISNVIGGEGADEEQNATAIRVVYTPANLFTEGDSLTITGVKGKERTNGTWRVRPFSNTSCDLIGSEGLDSRAYTSGGTMKQSATGTIRRRATENNDRWRWLGAFNAGEIEEFETSTIQINDQPISNFPDIEIQTRNGLASQTPIEGFVDQRITLAASGAEITPTPQIYTTQQNADSFVINIDFQEGLVHFTDRGESRDNFVDIQMRFRQSPSGSWSTPKTYGFVGDSARVLRVAIEQRNLGYSGEKTDIELTRTNVKHTGGNDRYRPFFTSVTEVVNGTEPYNNIALLALSGIASEQVQGQIPNPTVIGKWSKVLVGSNPTPQFDEHRAWCTRHYLTSPFVGINEADASIDLTSFQAWADRDDEQVDGENRHIFAYSLDRRATDQQVLIDILRGGEAELLKSEGLWTAKLTQNDAPVYSFNWAHVHDFTEQRIRDPERINVIQFAYLDPDNGRTVDTWPAESNWPAVVRKSELIELKGVQRFSEAQRYGQRELKRRQLSVRAVSFSIDVRALRLKHHEVFRLSHNHPGWGFSGLVLDNGTATLTSFETDNPITFESGKTYTCYVVHDDDSQDQVGVVNPGNTTTNRVNLSSSLGKIPVGRVATWAIGEEIGGGEDAAGVLFRCRDISPDVKENRVKIEGVFHTPQMYTDDPVVPLPDVSRLPNPAGPAPAIFDLLAVEETRIQPDGIARPIAKLTWRINFITGPGFNTYGGAVVYRRVVQGSGQMDRAILNTDKFDEIRSDSDRDTGRDFQRLGSVGQNGFEFEDSGVASYTTYVYRVVPVSLRGGVPNEIGADEFTIYITGAGGLGLRPATPANIRLQGQAVGVTEFEDKEVTIEWDPPSGTPLANETTQTAQWRVEVWLPGQVGRLHPKIGNPPQYVRSPRFTYGHRLNAENAFAAGRSGPVRDLEFHVWAVNSAGKDSASAAILGVFNPAEDMNAIAPSATPLYKGVLLDWTQFAEDRDHETYDVLIGTQNPPLTSYTGAATFGRANKKLAAQDLVAGVTYYAQIVPYDRFGPGVPSQVVSFVPLLLEGSDLRDDVVIITKPVQMGTAVVNEASIIDLNVTRAKIGDLQVDTIKIAGEAVTNKESFFTGFGSISIPDDVIEHVIGSITFAEIGFGYVTIDLTVNGSFNSSTGTVTFRIRKDTPTGLLLAASVHDPAVARYSPFCRYVDDAPASSNQVYYATVQRFTTGGSTSYSQATLLGENIKR